MYMQCSLLSSMSRKLSTQNLSKLLKSISVPTIQKKKTRGVVPKFHTCPISGVHKYGEILWDILWDLLEI